jgi:hypothetical protein
MTLMENNEIDNISAFRKIKARKIRMKMSKIVTTDCEGFDLCATNDDILEFQKIRCSIDQKRTKYANS